MGTTSPRVVIAGAGMAGLAMSDHLKRAGIDHTVYERAAEVGGTWRDNTFPGLYVDVLSRQYEFPFAPNLTWSRKFALGSEVQAYLLRVARERELRAAIRFEEEITEARFDEGRWHIQTSRGRSDVADVFVCATGFLSVPVYPDIKGRESFAGPAFHSARWDHSVEIAGKRWGIIGGGASGVQITEALAFMDCEVTQFIRRAQWVQIRENPATIEAEVARLKEPGAYERIQRELWDAYSESDSWRLKPGPLRERMQRDFNAFISVVRDPVLREKLTPKYPLGCTRIPKSDAYYEAVQRPNVHIETTSIERIVPEGVKLVDGSVVALDALVLATGFDAHAYMRPMRVTGVNGQTVDQLWKDGVYSYRGFALPGFPNFFMLYGPFSPVNNVSVPLGLEQQIGYIKRLIELGMKRRAAVMPSQAATQRFVERMRAALPGTVWVGCKNWYSDSSGTPILWPLPQDDHTAMLSRVAEEDLEFVSLPD
jgi:cation diffusion facilitator CzcD-associated flavoprotein CzcO